MSPTLISDSFIVRALAVAVAFTACAGDSGGDSPDRASTETRAAVELEEAAMVWFRHDAAAGTVEIDITAGEDQANGGWNYNGLAYGEAEIVVPLGATVTIHLANEGGMAHSVQVADFGSDPPAALDERPVFEGARSDRIGTADPATTITFVADREGDFALACHVPGHAVGGMWLGLSVSATETPAVMLRR